MHDEDHGEIVEVFDEERSPRCFELDPPEENEFCSPMRSSQYKMIEEPESSSSDRSGRPSPVSVLEPLFSDNEISPASNISRPVEYRIQPLCIQFEDQEICTRNCMENEESAFEYVEAVLLASDFNWDDFENRWLSSAQILDSSLFDEVEIFSSQPSYNQRLLFDSTNEILKEVCDCYIDFFSFVRRKIQPVPKGENLINEVWERIELHSTNNYPLSLDHLIKKDLEISKTWMNLGCDSREMVSEINDSIFEDMIDDTVLSLVNDHVDSET
ncbi:TRM32-like protein [Tanacetum coccineum]